MLPDYSDNAVMARVRALYGKRLTEADYDALLKKKNLGEAVAYLKQTACYAESLSGVSEESVRRGQLEDIVHRHVLDIFTRLTNLTEHSRRGALFLDLYIIREEVRQLLTAIRLLDSGAMERYIVTLPVHMTKLMSFDLFAVAKAESYSGLLKLLERTDYYPILSRFYKANGPVDITSCETALLTHFYARMLEISRRDYRGEARKELEELFRTWVALHNTSVIFRMRRFMNAGRDVIEPRLVFVEGDHFRRMYGKLMDAADLQEMRRLLESGPIFRKSAAEWMSDTRLQDAQTSIIKKKSTMRMFRFSTKPVLIVISYMTLLEIEVRNIINIIEGIRYELPPQDIKALLTL